MKLGKKFFVALFVCFIAFSLCLSCNSNNDNSNAPITKLEELPTLSKGYFGIEDSTVELDLSQYINKNGNTVSYIAEISDSAVANVQIEGDILSVTMKMGDATATLHIEAVCEEVTWFSWDTKIEALKYSTVACVGDSLTQGHLWGNESYPVYLEEALAGFNVMNYGRNGASVTGTNPNLYLKYDEQSEYEESIACNANIVIIMLGTNDSKAWDMAKLGFKNQYERLIQSYIDANPEVKIILVTAPPTMKDNKFDIPNDVIRDNICPIQREVAEEMGITLVDLREEMEKLSGGYEHFLRGDAASDGVHLSVEGAIFLAELLAETIKGL